VEPAQGVRRRLRPWNVRCRCREHLVVLAADRGDALAQAEALGWRNVGGFLKCPRCAKEKPKE
jgi:hypothetical protein